MGAATPTAAPSKPGKQRRSHGRKEDDGSARHLVYCLISPSGRRYVGQTDDMEKRLAAHRHKAPWRMAKDVEHYGSLQSFRLEVLAQGLGSRQADELEEHYISIFGTQTSTGYNDLAASPGRDRRFWYMLRRGFKVSRGRHASRR